MGWEYGRFFGIRVKKNKQLIIKSYLSCSYSSKIAIESFSNNSSIFEIIISENTDINYTVIPSLKKTLKL